MSLFCYNKYRAGFKNIVRNRFFRNW